MPNSTKEKCKEIIKIQTEIEYKNEWRWGKNHRYKENQNY